MDGLVVPELLRDQVAVARRRHGAAISADGRGFRWNSDGVHRNRRAPPRVRPARDRDDAGSAACTVTVGHRPFVYVITDRRRLPQAHHTASDGLEALEAFAMAVIDAAADTLQIRERDMPSGSLVPLIRRLVVRAKGTRTRIVVSDRVDIAAAADADGVHLPVSGLPVDAVRRFWPQAGVVGCSIHATDIRDDQATSAPAPDYWMFAPVFATVSKPGIEPAGLDLLTAACHMRRHVLALGGITTPQRAGACAKAGAAGVAGIGVFAAAFGAGPGRLRAVVDDLRSAMHDAAPNLLE